MSSSIQGSKSKDWINSMVIQIMGGGARNSESELKIPTVEPRIGYT
jgi:hypothetical protein